ncbi:MAG: PAS domain-containing protein, partial [Syntrophomonadaceae bacterium]|nr:PAS domain-containing protein [Syntrophomonadaceae bacterium]
MKTETNQMDFSILDLLQEPVIVIGKDLKVIFINDSLSSLVGKSLKQAKGTMAASLIKAEHSGIADVFDSGERVNFQTWATVKKNQMFLELTGNPVVNDDGEVTCVVEVIKDLTDQKTVINAIEELIAKAEGGDLTARATIKADGDFQDLINGVNDLLDAVISPVHDVIDILGRAAVNDFELIVKDYPGAWGELKSAINTVIGRLFSVTDVVTHVSQGNLGDISDLKSLGRRSENDNLIPALIHMLEEIQKLADDTHLLTRAALEGKLSERADASQHSGEFSKIVAGINETLDAILLPINEAEGCLKEMARGNLDVSMTGSYQGDHAMIKDALNHTLDSINEILNEVSRSTEGLATGSQQVSNSSQSLAQGATESAAALEEISSSMHELTAQTKQNAENAAQANQLADQARTDAIKGREQMNLMGTAMKDISDSAADISKIIKAIDEIAFQTN